MSSLLWKAIFLVIFISFYFFSSTFSGTHVPTMRTSSYAPGLVSLALSDPLLRFSREFRMCSTQYFTSLLFPLLLRGSTSCLPFRCQTALRVLAFHLILIKFFSLSYSVYARSWPCKGLYFYSLRKLNTYVKRPSAFFSSISVVRQTQFLEFLKTEEKETTRFFFWP